MLFCSQAYALPQDWPCFSINVQKNTVIEENDNNFEYAYIGETNGYTLNINLSGIYKFPSLFANCGTLGCSGTITEKSTKKYENLLFFCEEYNDDYTKVKCHIAQGDEFVFDKKNEKEYTVNYCIDNQQKNMKINPLNCSDCHCLAYWYDDNIKNKIAPLNLVCKKEQNKLHCFTNNGYEKWRNFESNSNDFQNYYGL